MSSRKRRRETKQLRDSYLTITLKEIEDEGLVTKNFHLFDRVDMKEYQLQTQNRLVEEDEYHLRGWG